MPAPTADTPEAADTTTSTTDEVLAREQAYLDHARAELRRMREDTERLDAAKASDAWIERGARPGAGPPDRLAAGRPAHDPLLRPDRHPHRARRPRPFHIGRRHVSDDARRPGRRRLARPHLHRLLPGVPARADGRRCCAAGSASTAAGSPRSRTSTCTTAADGRPATARILAAEIERPRTGPMRDIVSTIQPEQDEIVRSDIAISICVQGAPGTGKTAVGLHRAAWLLYSFRDAARPLRRARRRPQPRLPRPHRRGAALARRGAGRSRDDRDAARPRPGPRRGHHRGRDPQGRRTARRGAAPRRLGARRPRRRGARRPAGVATLAGARRTRSRTSSTQLIGARACATPPPAPAPPTSRPPRAPADGALRRRP